MNKSKTTSQDAISPRRATGFSRFGAIGLSVALVAAAGGCSEDKSKSTRPSAAQNKKKAEGLVAPEAFKRIPADSVFVFANYERWDQAQFDSTLGLLSDAVASSETDGEDEPSWAAKLIATNPDLLTPAGLKKIGVAASPLVALYTHELAFVVRVELGDSAAMRAFVTTSLAASESLSFEAKTLGSVSYWESSHDDATKLIAVDDKELVLSMMPSQVTSELVPYILGSERPSKNIIDSGELREVIAKHGGAMGAGYVNFAAGMELLTSGSRALQDTRFDLSTFSPVCQSEFKEIVKLAHKAVFGLDRLDAKKASIFLGIEMRQDVAKKFAATTQPVPGYSYARDSDALMAFGMGFNSNEFLSFISDIAKKLQSSPYQCEHLSDLNDDFSKADQGIDSLPPVLNDIVGYMAVFDTFDREDPMASTGMLAIESKDINALLAFARILLPATSKLELEIGKQPVNLELGSVAKGLDVYAGRSKRLLGLAVGDSRSKLNTLLSIKTPKQGPFLFLTMNFASPNASFTSENDSSEKAMRSKAIQAKLGAWYLELVADDSGLFLHSSLSFR